MGQHKQSIPKAERDGAWKRGQRPDHDQRVAEAIHTMHGKPKRYVPIATLPEPEGLE